MDLLADGLTNREIGARLGATPAHVRAILKSLSAKLDAPTRARILFRGRSLSLLPKSDDMKQQDKA